MVSDVEIGIGFPTKEEKGRVSSKKDKRNQRQGENEPDDLHHVDICRSVDTLVAHEEVSREEGDDGDEDDAEPKERGGEEEVVVSAEERGERRRSALEFD